MTSTGTARNTHQKRRKNPFFFFRFPGRCFGAYPRPCVEGGVVSTDTTSEVYPGLPNKTAAAEMTFLWRTRLHIAAVRRAVKASLRWFQQQPRQTSTT